MFKINITVLFCQISIQLFSQAKCLKNNQKKQTDSFRQESLSRLMYLSHHLLPPHSHLPHHRRHHHCHLPPPLNRCYPHPGYLKWCTIKLWLSCKRADRWLDSSECDDFLPLLRVLYFSSFSRKSGSILNTSKWTNTQRLCKHFWKVPWLLPSSHSPSGLTEDVLGVVFVI